MDRKKDMTISGGFSGYPCDRKVVAGAPPVVEAAVVDMRSEAWTGLQSASSRSREVLRDRMNGRVEGRAALTRRDH